ncbi:MAG: NifB/NifX family molybdenum-iron cluster-binding protein [Acidobacteriota bacterium]
MAKTAFITLLDRDDSALSPHFGKGKWVLIRDDNGQNTFEQNTVLNGRAVVDIMKKHGCTDAVFTEIGPGAFAHLEEAGIRGWIGPANRPVPDLAALLRNGELIRAGAPESGSKDHASHGGKDGQSCGCCGTPHTAEKGRGNFTSR